MTWKPEALHELAPDDKIRPFEEMPGIVHDLRHTGTEVILAQGVFDLLHVGHVGYLRAAHSQTDTVNPPIVIVGIENDYSVRANKGEKRPVNTDQERAEVLSELTSADLVFIYPDAPRYERAEDFIDRYHALGPSSVAVEDWDPHLDLKLWQAQEAGTELLVLECHRDNSTTRMLDTLGY